MAAICAALAVTTALVGCGGDNPPDPLQKYREQSVEWTACDPTILGTESQRYQAVREAAGDRLRCGFVRVPLDWSNTARGDLVVSVMRVAAGQPDKRRGALLFNPGGPGADGMANTFTLFNAFYKGNPDNPQEAAQLRLLDEYDMVGFSPRGTGASTRLLCATNELDRHLITAASTWDTPENIANTNYNGSKLAEACLKNPITPYINTDATARDLDLIRGLLGDDKLNYVGYSYGTWLGAWYASLFPEKVGRMVLDSSTDFTATLEQTTVLAQPPARQRLLDDVLVPYAVRHAGVFHLGNTDAEVRAVMPQLDPKVQQVLAGPIMDAGYRRVLADRYLMQMNAARGLDVALKAAANPADMDAVDAALNAYAFDPVNPSRNADIRTLARALQQNYAAMWLHPKPSSIQAAGEFATLIAVHCNDTPAITDPATWTATVRSMAQRAPMFMSTLLSVHVCPFWGGPKVSKPDLAPMKPLNVLFVQSQYDSATYTEGANAFFAQLPSAQRVYVRGDYQHGVYPYKDSCVDSLVTGYLLGNSLTQREAVCPAHPLQQDALVQGLEPKALAPSSSQEVLDLVDEFKRGLTPQRLR